MAFNMAMVEYRDGGLYWITSPRRGVPVCKRIGTTHKQTGYRLGSLAGESYREHILVWELHNGPVPDGMDVDHIDGVRDSNRISNLRLATRQENCQNSTVCKNNKLGIKNVITRLRGNCLQYIGTVDVGGVVHRKSSTSKEVVVAWVHSTRAALHGEFLNNTRKVG